MTLAILTWFIVPDDGLESLMALPLSAALVAITAFARASGSAHGALHRTRGVVAGATAASLVVGGLMGLTGDPADFFSAAVSFAFLGGGFVAVGGGVGFVLRAGPRLMLSPSRRGKSAC